jgi:hypothetical protein
VPAGNGSRWTPARLESCRGLCDDRMRCYVV